MGNERRVKLLRIGRSQAIRIPREFELPGNKAVLRKDGARLIIEPVRRRSLLAVLSRLRPLSESIPVVEDEPPEPVDL